METQEPKQENIMRLFRPNLSTRAIAIPTPKHCGEDKTSVILKSGKSIYTWTMLNSVADNPGLKPTPAVMKMSVR